MSYLKQNSNMCSYYHARSSGCFALLGYMAKSTLPSLSFIHISPQITFKFCDRRLLSHDDTNPAVISHPCHLL
jgi:hypothetical protein